MFINKKKLSLKKFGNKNFNKSERQNKIYEKHTGFC